MCCISDQKKHHQAETFYQQRPGWLAEKRCQLYIDHRDHPDEPFPGFERQRYIIN
jgi:hypothetical protein